MDTNSPKTSVLQSLIGEPDNGKKEKNLSDTTFEMRPDISKRFKSAKAKEVMWKILQEHLFEKTYSQESAEQLTKEIANSVRNQLEGVMYERYKLIVNVVLGERKGEGVKMGSRCLWDPETDSYASQSFLNESLFCVVTVYGILYY